MSTVRRKTRDFVTLRVQLNSLPSRHKPATHYLYVKPHDPPLADQDAPRSLFLVNLPFTATESHIRHIFGTQLSAGRVERVDFSEAISTSPLHSDALPDKRSKKRKRVTAEELSVELGKHKLPDTWQRTLQPSGSSAVVVFVDRPSMALSLKAVEHAAKVDKQVIWEEGVADKLPVLGLRRYIKYNKTRYPTRRGLLQSVDSYMTAYSKMEEARSREIARKRQVPDEEGFITVTKGTRGGAVRKEDAKEIGEKRKENNTGLEDFYRFQMREKRKEQQGELTRKFEEDKRKVEEMKKRRGRLQPE